MKNVAHPSPINTLPNSPLSPMFSFKPLTSERLCSLPPFHHCSSVPSTLFAPHFFSSSALEYRLTGTSVEARFSGMESRDTSVQKERGALVRRRLVCAHVTLWVSFCAGKDLKHVKQRKADLEPLSCCLRYPNRQLFMILGT